VIFLVSDPKTKKTGRDLENQKNRSAFFRSKNRSENKLAHRCPTHLLGDTHMDFKSLRAYVEELVAEQSIKASSKIIENVLAVEELFNQKVVEVLDEVESFLAQDDSPEPEQAKPAQQFININVDPSLIDFADMDRITKTIKDAIDRMAAEKRQYG
jgi:hypothetical protein